MVEVKTLGLVASTVLPLLAWMVTRRQRSHLYVAAYASWIGCVDLLRRNSPLQSLVLDRALSLSYSFFFLACLIHYFLTGRAARTSTRVILGLWPIVFVWLAASPPLSVAVFQRAFLATYSATTVIAWVVILAAVSRRRELRPTLSHLALVLYAAGDAVAICFPLLHWRVDEWRIVMVGYLICLTTSIVAHLVFLFSARTEPARLGQTSG